MKTINNIPFPETKEEAAHWPKSKLIRYRALHSRVLAVFVPRIEGAFSVYVTPVPGENHDEESRQLWQVHGSKLSERVARAIFSDYDDLPYAD